MKYIDPSTGREYTEEELLELAGDMPLQDYIADKGYMQLMEEIEPVVTEVSESDFQPATANEGVGVVADIPEAPENTELDLETASLESVTERFKPEDQIYNELKIAESELQKWYDTTDFNYGPSKKSIAERKKLEQNVGIARRNLQAADINFEVPETWIDKSQQQVIKALRAEFPGIVFEETGANILTYGNEITANLGGEKVKLDLKPFTEKGRKVIVENFDKVLAYDKIQKANNLVNQGALSGIMDPVKDGIINYETINKSLVNTVVIL